MTHMEMEKLLEIGISLSAEKDYNRLLENILSDAMILAHCDAGALYIKEGDFLSFRIIRNNTRGRFLGGDGETVDFPPIPLKRDNVCACALLTRRTLHVDDMSQCTDYDFSDQIRYDRLMGYSTVSMLAVPMENRSGEPVGVLQLINATADDGMITPFPWDTERMAESVASQAAIAIENVNYVKSIKELFHSFVQVLSSAIDERTPYNAAHTRNMVKYGGRFLDYENRCFREKGEGVFITPEHRDEILMSIWLHDIGKLVTPLEVMNKATRMEGRMSELWRRMDVISLQNRIDVLEGRISPEAGAQIQAEIEQAREVTAAADSTVVLSEEILEQIRRLGEKTYRDVDGTKRPWLTAEEVSCLSIRKGTLTEEERRIMENHVSVTEKLLAQIRFSKDYEHVPFWASSHHEFLDGSGYPRKLRDGEIPYEVRVITILDIFDALTASDRPYKEGMPVGQALSVLKTMAYEEKKLDEALTARFIRSRCWV